MKELKINYQEYVLPKETNSFQRVGKFICEYFGFKTYRVDKIFTIKVENPELFLANNNSFTVNRALLPVLEDEYKKEKDNKEVQFSILKWQYKFGNDESQEIVVTAGLPKTNQIEALYASSEKWKFFFPLFSLAAVFLVALISYVFITGYPQPLWFWTFIGKYIQTAVAWSLALLMFSLFIWSIGFYRGSEIIKSFLNLIFIMLTGILPVTWLAMSAKPAEFVGAPNEHILYLSHLRNYFSAVLLILLGTVPWLTIFLKHFGLSLIPSILGRLHGKYVKSE